MLNVMTNMNDEEIEMLTYAVEETARNCDAETVIVVAPTVDDAKCAIRWCSLNSSRLFREAGIRNTYTTSFMKEQCFEVRRYGHSSNMTKMFFYSSRQIDHAMKTGGMKVPDAVYKMPGANTAIPGETFTPWYMRDAENETLDEYPRSLSNSRESVAAQQ